MLREMIEQLDKLPQKVLANSLEIDTSKPIIAVISAENGISAAHANLREVTDRVKKGIVSAGGTPVVMHVPSVDTTALYGTSATKYDLPARELTANSVELLAGHDLFDALVFVAGEPNVTAGMLTAAIRLNIPSIFVAGGTMSPIVCEGEEHGFVHVYEQIAKIKTGKTPYEKLNEIENNLPLALGTDCERYGANSFNCVLEALGLAVKGNGTAPASCAERKKLAFETGKFAVAIADEKFTPRRILTQTALINALTLDLACGGSSTTVLNVLAVAKELGIRNVTLKFFNDLSKSTPVLLFHENRGKAVMTEFNEAGGVYGMLKQLAAAKLVKTDILLYNGMTLADALEKTEISNTNVLRPADNCVHPSAFLRVLYGNVAEEGSLVQYAGGETSFTGTAKVYDNSEIAIDALLHREIRAGDVVVIKNEGPKSGPGMREIFMPFALLKGFGLESKVAVITDGRIADFYGGFAVGHITPESIDQNVFSVLQDGDEIEISVTKGKISCDLKAKELSQRYRDHDSGSPAYANSYLKNWAKMCSSASEGCVIKFGKR